MERFIGCDSHEKFSVFVAVNEKGRAGEALRVVHDRVSFSGTHLRSEFRHRRSRERMHAFIAWVEHVTRKIGDPGLV